MTVNVGPRDRIVRAIITVAALIGAVSVGISTPLGIALAVVAVVAALTAAVRFCPVYRALGLSTAGSEAADGRLPHSVRAHRALELLQHGAQVIDVREVAEWKTGHAAQATHIPLGQVASSAGRLTKDRPVVVMCQTGTRSRSAAHQLRSQGFEATSLSGGIGAWRAAGGAVVGSRGR
jgi:rhodanese-related sulfurtransferase